ncbi:MAG: asparagine synthase-related protein [Pseudomonadota bacterium]
MTGLCGWDLASAPTKTDPAVLQAMRRQLPPMDAVSEEVVEHQFAGCVQAMAHGQLHRAADVMVLIDGNPRLSGSNQSNAAAVAALYDRYDLDFVQHVSGTFAIAIVDQTRKRTVLAVDRTGTQPLAYHCGQSVVFASTSTAVYAHPDVPRGLDHQSLYNYLYFHMIPSPRTIFESVKKLPPAHMLVAENKRITLTRYWMPDYTRANRSSLQGRLLTTLGTAVDRAASSNASGAFLSGGLDSSTVCGLLQQQRAEKANVFTIGFAQEGYDELEYARLAADHFGLNLTSYYITPEDVLSALPEVAKAYDEPFGNSSAVPTLVCARLARKAGIDTLLAGDGGDELFGGNERYATQKLFSYYDYMPGVLDRAIMRPFFFRDAVKRRSSGFQHKVRRYIEQASMAMPERTQNYNLLHLLGADTVFTREFLSNVDADEPRQLLRAEYWQDGIPDQLERLLFMDYKFTLADNDLRKVNRMCALAGVQVKYPMLDDEMVAFSNTVPSNVKLKGQVLRSYFKDETRAFLPSDIINKSKHGFGLPFGEWLKLDPDLSRHIHSNIERLRDRHVFSPAFVDDLLDKHENQHAAYYGNLVWVMAMLEEWLTQHALSV